MVPPPVSTRRSQVTRPGPHAGILAYTIPHWAGTVRDGRVEEDTEEVVGLFPSLNCPHTDS
jgi:hypothetical protein